MYVCICNALNEKKLAAAAGGEPCTVQEVFRRCGERPQCGKCLNHVAEVIEKSHQMDGHIHARAKLAAE